MAAYAPTCYDLEPALSCEVELGVDCLRVPSCCFEAAAAEAVAAAEAAGVAPCLDPAEVYAAANAAGDL